MLEPSPNGKERSNLEAMEKKQIKKGRSKITSFNAVEHRGRWSQMLCTWCAAQANPNRVLDDRPSLIDQTIQNRGENLVSIYEMDKTGHPSTLIIMNNRSPTQTFLNLTTGRSDWFKRQFMLSTIKAYFFAMARGIGRRYWSCPVRDQVDDPCRHPICRVPFAKL